MANLTVCSAAEADFSESLGWYAEQSKQAAIDFDAEVDLALQTIASDPLRFPRCDDRHHFFLMRRFPFQIIYRILNQNVTIIAFAHTSRQPFWRDR
jgi:plasmid stabilization system protein ParE